MTVRIVIKYTMTLRIKLQIVPINLLEPELFF